MEDPNILPGNIDLSSVYPDLTPEQLAEAEYNLTRYVNLVRRIYERTHNLTDSEELTRLQ